MSQYDKRFLDSNLTFTIHDLIHMFAWIPLNQARFVFAKHTSLWGELISHLNNAGGIMPRPVIPQTTTQSLAFLIDEPNEIRTAVYNSNTKKIACILCINDKESSSSDDDTISVILIGLDGHNRPTSLNASEKWPTAFTVSQTAQTVIDNYLTPGGNPPNDLAKAQGLVRNFEAMWTNLVADCQAPLANRPNIVKEKHPVAFILPPDDFKILLENKNFSKMAGFFGYTEIAGSANPGIISPFFVGLNQSNEPVTDFIFTDVPSLHNYKYDTDRNDVSNYLLTLR